MEKTTEPLKKVGSRSCNSAIMRGSGGGKPGNCLA